MLTLKQAKRGTDKNTFYYTTGDGHAECPELSYDPDEGEGMVTFPPGWTVNAKIWRLDVLSDWICLLQDKYDQELEKRD